MTRGLLVTILAFALAACARYSDVEPASVGPGYVTGGGTWNTGGGITTAVQIRERDGKTVVCGAWTTDQQSVLTHGRNDDVMEVASVYAGGTRLVQNLGFMARARYSENITGAQANCVRSSVNWRPEFAETGPRVRIPRIAFTEVGDDTDAGGSSVVFREAPRPDIVG